MSVNAPTTLFNTPFASGGDKTVIPAQNSGNGRANLTTGFPVETQLPIQAGGLPPNRLDFNGIFNMITSFCWWMQSGGQWEWRNTLDYKAPAIVFRSGKTYFAVTESGPGTSAGMKDPATDTAGTYWKLSLAGFAPDGVTIFVNGQGQLEAKKTTGVPTGVVLPYYGLTPPDGFFLCNGAVFSQSAYPELYAVLGKNTLPDLRGEFLRFLDMGRGVDAGRTLGSAQSDGTRLNEAGSFSFYTPDPWGWSSPNIQTTGGFSWKHNGIVMSGSSNHFDYHISSATITMGSGGDKETRPRNIAFVPIIKY